MADAKTVTPEAGALPKFQLGRTVMTRGVHALVASGQFNPLPFLLRHARGDWGDLCDEDVKSNNQALRLEGRLMSSYKVGEMLILWIITEWDRSVTTLLLPSEY